MVKELFLLRAAPSAAVVREQRCAVMCDAGGIFATGCASRRGTQLAGKVIMRVFAAIAVPGGMKHLAERIARWDDSSGHTERFWRPGSASERQIASAAPALAVGSARYIYRA